MPNRGTNLICGPLVAFYEEVTCAKIVSLIVTSATFKYFFTGIPTSSVSRVQEKMHHKVVHFQDENEGEE